MLYREFAEKKLGENIRDHIKAVIISHSHADHYGGVEGIVSKEQVGTFEEGKIPIIVPAGFDEETVSENIYARTAMSRRGRYQFAYGLRPGKKSVVSGGLGLSGGRNFGEGSYIAPTYEIDENKTLVIDGLEIEFQLTPGTEAPAEMNNYFPQYRAFWAAEAANEDFKFILELTDVNETFTLHLYAGTLLVYKGKAQGDYPIVKGPKKIITAWIAKDLDSVKEEIQTTIYDQLKKIEDYIVDVNAYSQFPIIDR